MCCSPRARAIVADVTEQSWSAAIEWLTIPDVAELLGEPLSRVRRLLDERHFLALRQDGVLRAPSEFFVQGRILSSLHGTIVVLDDAGFRDDEIVEWLFSPEASIGATPIEALRAGRKREVRRVARTLA